MSEQTLVRFKNVEKSYLDKKPLFSNINTKVSQGEFLFLTGVSGAGKSTIFKLIMGLEKPNVGQIFFSNKEVNSISTREMPDHRRKIGMVFQDYKLLTKKTVEENIAIPLQIQGYSSSKIKKKTIEVAGKIGIEHQLKQPIQSLSGGEQQLVAIARASIHTPRLILADEPTANLDQKMADRIIKMLLSLNEDGITVIIATHDVSLIRSHEKRILLIKQSGLIEVH